MTACNDTADYEWLTGEEASVVLAELAECSAPLHRLVAQLRRRLPASRVHLVLDQADIRRRARTKFSNANSMYFTRIGLEQATDEWIASYKAQRFEQLVGARSGGVADLCCGIGGDLFALGRQGKAVGVDLSPVHALFARANARVAVRLTDAAEFNLRDVSAWHIDPDRRAGGHRTTTLEHYEPSISILKRLLAQSRNAAVKLAPATRVPPNWMPSCELEWISRDRECRQQIAWHGMLATVPGEHRATVITALPGERAGQHSARSVTGSPNQPVAITSKADRFIFDTDPAIRAARLTGVLAAEYNLAALAPGASYLTGTSAIDDPTLANFEIADALPFDARKLAGFLRARSIGQLEIKKRGIELDLENLRRTLKLRGTNAATLLITPVGGRVTAFLANRLR